MRRRHFFAHTCQGQRVRAVLLVGQHEDGHPSHRLVRQQSVQLIPRCTAARTACSRVLPYARLIATHRPPMGGGVSMRGPTRRHAGMARTHHSVRVGAVDHKYEPCERG
jgi:hypothetical protein